MEHRAESRLEKLLAGRADGVAVALRGCADGCTEALTTQYGDSAPGRVRVFEPSRVEHPHSAFLRKTVDAHGRQAVQTTLYAPGGKLAEERLLDGQAVEHFVKKQQDFETLRGFLRDVELYPAKSLPHTAGTAVLANLGLTPVRELETRWAGPELTGWALMSQDESAASCLRKLERHLHRRAEEACRAGSRACVLKDMSACPLPETYLLQAGRHIEWLRHNGLFPWVEVAEPNGPLLAALHAACAGARMDLINPALYEEQTMLPEGMRLLLDVSAGDDLSLLEADGIVELLKKCGSAVMLVDCFQAEREQLIRTLDCLQKFVK